MEKWSKLQSRKFWLILLAIVGFFLCAIFKINLPEQIITAIVTLVLGYGVVNVAQKGVLNISVGKNEENTK